MASFDSHLKCAHCRDKGDCVICKGFTHEQNLQLATPTYRECKSKEKKLVSSSPAPTLVDPSHLSVLGKVEGDKVVQPETTVITAFQGVCMHSFFIVLSVLFF